MVYNKTELAKKTGISRQTIIKILNGTRRNPKIETLTKISNCLDCSIENLLENIKKETSLTTAKKSNLSQCNNEK